MRQTSNWICWKRWASVLFRTLSMFQNMMSRHLADLRQQEDSIFDMVEMSTGVRLRPMRQLRSLQLMPMTQVASELNWQLQTQLLFTQRKWGQPCSVENISNMV